MRRSTTLIGLTFLLLSCALFSVTYGQKGDDAHSAPGQPEDRPIAMGKPSDRPSGQGKPEDRPNPPGQPDDRPNPPGKPEDRPNPRGQPEDRPNPPGKPEDRPNPRGQPEDRPNPPGKPEKEHSPSEDDQEDDPEHKPTKPRGKPEDDPEEDPEDKPTKPGKPEDDPEDKPTKPGKPEDDPEDKPTKPGKPEDDPEGTPSKPEYPEEKPSSPGQPKNAPSTPEGPKGTPEEGSSTPIQPPPTPEIPDETPSLPEQSASPPSPANSPTSPEGPTSGPSSPTTPEDRQPSSPERPDDKPSTPSTPGTPGSPPASPGDSDNVPTTPGKSPQHKPVPKKCHDKAYPFCYNVQILCPTNCPHNCYIDCRTCSPVCSCDKPGAACQDPRFIGADGITFYFHGKKDKDFCLVTDSDLHINAHFIGKRSPHMVRDFTWIQSIGILFGDHQVYLGAHKTGLWDDKVDHLEMVLDGEPIELLEQEGASWRTKMEPTILSVIRISDVNSVTLEVEGQFKITAKVVPISKEESRVHNYGITDDDCFAHLELGFKFMSLTSEVDGVLGQTYRDDYVSRVKMSSAMPIMGGDAKYVTSSLFSIDSSVVKFTGGRGGSGIVMLAQQPDMKCQSRLSGPGVVCKR